MLKPRALVVLTLVFAMFASLALAGSQLMGNKGASPADAAAAQRVAQTWLTTMDEGRYGDAWELAAPVFKEAVPKAKWVQMAGAVRAPLGVLAERTVTSATYTDELPGAPDGHYVVIQTKARFANKANAVETVTPMKTADGTWRVSGYFVR